MRVLALALLGLALPLFGQAPATATSDAWKSLAFLEGTWEAKAEGSSGASANGTYSFALELGGHVLARHSRTADCKAPSSFDCAHGDLLYVYEEAPGGPLKAIYFDSEGHVIHYAVSTPTATTAVFVSEPAKPGPPFKLSYELRGAE
jgi:hypothetical protein